LLRLLAVLPLPVLIAPSGFAFDACDCDGHCRAACSCGTEPEAASGSCHDAAPARPSAALTEEGCECCVGDATPAPAPVALPPLLRDPGPLVAIAPDARVTCIQPRAASLPTVRPQERHAVSPLAARLRPLLR